ncbi:hypothetical protein Tco_1146118 [Tanacetum coccineum]
MEPDWSLWVRKGWVAKWGLLLCRLEITKLRGLGWCLYLYYALRNFIEVLDQPWTQLMVERKREDARRPGEDMCGSYKVMWRGYGMSKECYGARWSLYKSGGEETGMKTESPPLTEISSRDLGFNHCNLDTLPLRLAGDMGSQEVLSRPQMAIQLHDLIQDVLTERFGTASNSFRMFILLDVDNAVGLEYKKGYLTSSSNSLYSVFFISDHYKEPTEFEIQEMLIMCGDMFKDSNSYLKSRGSIEDFVSFREMITSQLQGKLWLYDEVRMRLCLFCHHQIGEDCWDS